MTDLTGRLTERLMIGAGGGFLVGAIVIVDQSVRTRVLGFMNGGMANELANAGEHVQHAVRLVNESIPFDGVAHSTVGLFMAAALALFAMMLKV
jgi:hypothetical protein